MTRVTGLGSYTIPRIDVQLGATFRSDQGGALAANYTATNASIAPSLGRNLSNNAPNVTVNLIAPGTVYGDRVNALDLRFVKILKFGRTRSNVGFELYNVTNSAAVLTYNQAFIPGGAWLTPTSVLQSRYAKISAQIDFLGRRSPRLMERILARRIAWPTCHDGHMAAISDNSHRAAS